MNRLEQIAIGLGLALSSVTAHAATNTEEVIQICLSDAARAFGVPSLPLRILRDVEGGQLGTASRNTDGTFDYGPMQINSSWLPMLARLGVTEHDLRYNPCVNAYVATWIFFQEWSASKHDVVMSMARYNSHHPYYQAQYLAKVVKAIDRRIARSPELANR